jgi:hypothetical protein
MQEELIKSNLAKLANENAIKLQSEYFYVNEDLYLLAGDGDILYQLDSNYNIISTKYDCDGEFWFDENEDENEPIKYYALTQSLVQKWFRDVHDMHIEIIYTDFYYMTYDENGEFMDEHNRDEFTYKIKHHLTHNKCTTYTTRRLSCVTYLDTFEECLEQALTKCFELI